jgi:hypothetical protein
MSTSPYVSFSTIHRVEVQVPEAAHAVETSGQDAYAGVIEWGEAPTRQQCVTFADYWHNKILQWQQTLRDEA